MKKERHTKRHGFLEKISMLFCILFYALGSLNFGTGKTESCEPVVLTVVPDTVIYRLLIDADHIVAVVSIKFPSSPSYNPSSYTSPSPNPSPSPPYLPIHTHKTTPPNNNNLSQPYHHIIPLHPPLSTIILHPKTPSPTPLFPSYTHIPPPTSQSPPPLNPNPTLPLTPTQH